MSGVKQFDATDWWELRGRGWVANIAGIAGLNPRELVGQQVEIDGRAYDVLGVETFCLLDRSVAGTPFGLLVSAR